VRVIQRVNGDRDRWRQAQTQEAKEAQEREERWIAVIHSDAFPSESPLPSSPPLHMRLGDRACLGAFSRPPAGSEEEAPELAGFCDAFQAVPGRIEVDLIAVHRRFRGRGVGARLVHAALAANGVERELDVSAAAVDDFFVRPVAGGAGDFSEGPTQALADVRVDSCEPRAPSLARALVRVGNTASERLFASCGFERGENVVLCVAAATGSPPSSGFHFPTGPDSAHSASQKPLPDGFRVIPVKTVRLFFQSALLLSDPGSTPQVNYTGVWVEAPARQWSSDSAHRALRAGLALRDECSMDVTGACVPVEEVGAVLSAFPEFDEEGKFCWWLRRAVPS
jgi:GNAT superfamily N-acetyltransferase